VVLVLAGEVPNPVLHCVNVNVQQLYDAKPLPTRYRLLSLRHRLWIRKRERLSQKPHDLNAPLD